MYAILSQRKIQMAITMLDMMLRYYKPQIENNRSIFVINVTDLQNISTHVMKECPIIGEDSQFREDVVKAWNNYNPSQGVIVIIVNTKVPKTTMIIKQFPWLQPHLREKLCKKCGMNHELVTCPDISEEDRQKLKS